MAKTVEKTIPQHTTAPARFAPEARAALRAWYRANARSLPWRERPTIYKTVVAEFMLQQTQVATVLPYFARWLEQFPNFAALASADEAEVLRAWEGLGYYSRARRLRALAAELARRRQLPRTPEEWRALPGVGPYTAAAITSIAFRAPAAVVDGNVVRVLSRLLGDDTLFPDNIRAVKAFTEAAGILLDRAHPGDHNQAMMELGATVCVKRRPRCGVCPLSRWCVARKAGNAADLPRLARKTLALTGVTRLWIEREGALLLHRRPDNAPRLAGMCELPALEHVPGARLARKPMAVKRRGIVNHVFVESIFQAALAEGAPDPASQPPGELLWASPAQLNQLTLSGPHRRWIRELRKRPADI